MEKVKVTIGVLAILLIIVSVYTYITYNSNVRLERDNRDLADANSRLLEDKEQLNNQIKDLDSELSLLKDDVFQLKKSCLTNNACRTHFPGIRWMCNVQGDAVSNPSHICVCNDNCELNATQISN